MPAYLRKPVSPIWQPGRAPAGCKVYLPFCETAGGTFRGPASSYTATASGSGVAGWEPVRPGPYGPQVAGFTTTRYLSVNTPPQWLYATYPCWMAVLTSGADATTANAISAGNSGSLAFACLGATTGTSYNYTIRNDAGTTVGTSWTATVDALPHVLAGVSYSPTDHRLYVDGRERAARTTAVGACTYDLFTVGVILRSAAAQPWVGAIQWAGAGVGAVPDLMALAQDLLSGRFSAVRPRNSFAALAAAIAPAPPSYRPRRTAGVLGSGVF